VHEIAILLRDVSQSPEWPARCRLQFTQLALYYRNNQHSALALAVDVVLALRRSHTPDVTPRIFWHALSVGIAKNATVVAQRGAHRNTQTLMRDVALQIVCKSQRSELPVPDSTMDVIRCSFRPVIVRDSPRVPYQPVDVARSVTPVCTGYAPVTTPAYTPADTPADTVVTAPATANTAVDTSPDTGNMPVAIVKPKKIKPVKNMYAI
jgi:hypothetical protein